MDRPLSADLLQKIDAYWRAANYLSVGQIYLRDNPLLREPLKREHIKARLLGHFGTTPGLNFVYVHMNRAIKKYDLDAIYITGPGHGAPGIVANTYLEGTDLPLAAIAERTGFAGAQYLVDVFRRKTGQTPGAFRRRHGKTVDGGT